MIGIYKITEKNNPSMFYVGKSTDIERRFGEHKSKTYEQSRIPFDGYIKEKGKDAFLYEVLEECSYEVLSEREKYWTDKLNATKSGNVFDGGLRDVVGNNNPNAKVNDEIVKLIRIAYNNHQRKKEVYDLYAKNTGLTFTSFEDIWQGNTWTHIMPEVYTEENKKYYSIGQGCINTNKYSDDEVRYLRQEYVSRTAKDIYESLKKEDRRVSFQSFQAILNGTTYTHLPYYLKKQKIWINPGEEKPKASENRGKNNNVKRAFTDAECLHFREEYVNKTAKEIYNESETAKKICFDQFQKMLSGRTYNHLKYYKKTTKEWIEPIEN